MSASTVKIQLRGVDCHQVINFHQDLVNFYNSQINMTPPLTNINLSTIKNDYQNCLFDLLDKFEGTKSIIWDDNLIGPFELVAKASSLKQHDTSKLFRLSDIKVAVFNEIKTDFILFFTRKDYDTARSIADILSKADRATLAKTSLVFVPYKCVSIEKLLEQYKVDLSKLKSIEELNIELYVLDTDIISTETEDAFSDFYIKEDYSFAHQITKGLIKLQDLYGQIPKISGQGKSAKLICDLLLKQRKQQTRPSNPAIQQLILIDRRIDLITPLLTQLTYEGLIDELFGVNHGKVTLPSERFDQFEENQTPHQSSDESKEPTTKKFELRSSEDLFARLRDCHINAVADILKQSARTLQAEYEECNLQEKTIPEISKIVKRINHLKVAKKSQFNHVAIAELVNEQTLKPEFIYGLRIEHELLQEDRLNRVIPEIDTKLLRQEPVFHVLRLICLQSMLSNGFKSKIGDYYKRELIQNYGPSCIPFILQLEKANILVGQEPDSVFSQLKNKLNLVKDDVDECNPRDLSYVYGGYSPISVLVARILASNQNRIHYDQLKLLPEPTFNHVESNTNQLTASLLNVTMANNARMRKNSTTSSLSSNVDAKTILVFFIGGCTFAEISALRFLSQRENCSFLIGTTKIINGRTFLKSLCPLNNELID